MKGKKIIALVVSILFVFALAACGGGEAPAAPADDPAPAADPAPAPAAGDEEILVGYSVMQMADAFWDNHVKGMEQAIADSGRNIKLEVADSAYDPQVAIQNSQSLIDRGAKVLVIGGPDENITGAIMEMANAKSVPVVSVGFAMEGGYFMTFDDYESGQIAGDYAGQYFAENFAGVPAKICLLGAFSLESISRPRLDGFVDAFKEYVPDTEVVAEVNSEGQRETGANVAADAMTANPDINVIFGVNDDCVLGAVASVEARGAADKVVCFGLGGISDEPFHALQDPNSPFKGTVAFSPFNYGMATINEYVLPLLDGQTPPTRINAPLALATPDNVADYLP